MTGVQPMQFQQLQSAINPSFWADFTKLKLEILRLSESGVPLYGFYGASSSAKVLAPIQLDSQSLLEIETSSGRVRVPGELTNVNTLETFKSYDRATALQQVASQIWQDVLSGAAEANPALLGRFLLLSYAELKSYRYYYWFAFPAIKPPSPFPASAATSLTAALGQATASKLMAASEKWLSNPGKLCWAPFWLLSKAVDGTVTAHPLSAWHQVRETEVLIGMVDPGNLPEHPSWPLRNMLLLACKRWGLRKAKVVCLRIRGGRPSAENSLYLDVDLPQLPPGWGEGGDFVAAAVGWEPNVRGKLGARVADLGPAMDPARLAESAADLNIRLMKWRAAPGLNIDSLAATRCLLLGAGTLGCAVARTLLGWGVRKITLLDNSRVSFSNPVRQSLYDFGDCLNGGAPKAAAAAAKLRAIFPKVEAEGVELSIPMPGHSISESELAETEADAARLEELIKAHDVVYLLMDTRESRWLPTLLAAAHGKLAINAALGFDSFLVMRHGASPLADVAAEANQSQVRLGCYYCNDVVAPLDSTLNRTLDQQCTVARPGLAPIAGALAVELMAAVLQHPQGVKAPAPLQSSQPGQSSAQTALGPAPHMIRGQLGGFCQMCLTGQAFRQCTACSAAVVSAFRQRGWTFILEALQEPKKLEDLTGLTELHASAALDDAEFEDSDEDALGNAASDEFVTL